MDAITALQVLNGMNQMANGDRDSQKQQNYNLELMDKQYQYNQRGAEEQARREREMFEYTSPEHRVEQLKSAGLNPGLIYGMGGGGGATTANLSSPSVGLPAAPNVAQSTANKTAQVGMALQLAKLKSEIDLNQSAAEVNKTTAEMKSGIETQQKTAEIGKIQSETLNKDIMNKFAEIELEIKTATKFADIDKITALANQAKVALEKSILEYGIDKATAETRIKQYNANLQKTIIDTLTANSQNEYNKQKVTESINEIAQRWIDRTLTVEQMRTEIQKTLMNNNTTIDAAQLHGTYQLMQGLLQVGAAAALRK